MSSASGPVAGMERHQVAVYVSALAVGALMGWAAPGAGPVWEHAINPVLAALLYVTFLQVPAAELGRCLRAGRFLGAARHARRGSGRGGRSNPGRGARHGRLRPGGAPAAAHSRRCRPDARMVTAATGVSARGARLG